MLALRSGLFLLRGDLEAAREDARLALESAERTTAGVLLAAAIARVGQVETYSADVTPGLLERGAEIEQRLGVTLEYQDSPRYALARLQMRLGQLESARALLEEAQAKAAARGDEGSRASALSVLSMLDWLAGHWPRALDQAMRAHELVEQIGHAHARLWLGRGKALVEADLGLVDDARLSAERGLAFARSNANEFYVVVTRGVLGRLELGLANLEAAEAHLRELPGWLLARGLNDPTLPVWADAIETLVLVGDSELARAYLEPYEQNARRLGSPWALAVAARCRGLLFAVDGELQLALDAFDRALTQLEAHPYPLEQARTLLCLGQVRRQAQQRKAAREALARSLAIFEGLGAPLWSEKARAELKRISGRPPTSDALTETELRVAVLASRGRSNREISAELFMGISTVERHLSHAYRKFGVRSRADLGPCLAAQGSEAPKAKDATTHT
jgi:DNA-binding CsgD family transcriptional regulator